MTSGFSSFVSDGPCSLSLDCCPSSVGLVVHVSVREAALLVRLDIFAPTVVEFEECKLIIGVRLSGSGVVAGALRIAGEEQVTDGPLGLTFARRGSSSDLKNPLNDFRELLRRASVISSNLSRFEWSGPSSGTGPLGPFLRRAIVLQSCTPVGFIKIDQEGRPCRSNKFL